MILYYYFYYFRENERDFFFQNVLVSKLKSIFLFNFNDEKTKFKSLNNIISLFKYSKLATTQLKSVHESNCFISDEFFENMFTDKVFVKNKKKHYLKCVFQFLSLQKKGEDIKINL